MDRTLRMNLLVRTTRTGIRSGRLSMDLRKRQNKAGDMGGKSNSRAPTPSSAPRAPGVRELPPELRPGPCPKRCVNFALRVFRLASVNDV